ncbi:hypothetical protein DMC30DRAFT_402188 [Rhodotorula diobovata]|uniref:Uncharacterized protein n=1 Tax=Rhodotorula diobovata TaxID=5288 RepID=A0A5C5FQ89_9BASI|nr:hypothetical protein DMC30DRAFT_402188 [Rhodotorula diobovata]
MSSLRRFGGFDDGLVPHPLVLSPSHSQAARAPTQAIPARRDERRPEIVCAGRSLPPLAARSPCFFCSAAHRDPHFQNHLSRDAWAAAERAHDELERRLDGEDLAHWGGGLLSHDPAALRDRRTFSETPVMPRRSHIDAALREDPHDTLGQGPRSEQHRLHQGVLPEEHDTAAAAGDHYQVAPEEALDFPLPPRHTVFSNVSTYAPRVGDLAPSREHGLGLERGPTASSASHSAYLPRARRSHERGAGRRVGGGPGRRPL